MHLVWAPKLDVFHFLSKKNIIYKQMHMQFNYITLVKRFSSLILIPKNLVVEAGSWGPTLNMHQLQYKIHFNFRASGGN